MSFAFIFGDVGSTEWLVLLGVILIVVGPKNLPSAARKLGQIMSKLRRAADEFKRQLMSMDQEVRSTVDHAMADDTSSSSASSDSSSASSTDDTAVDEGGNPYPEGSPYPGHEDFYDETSYGDGYGADGAYGEANDGEDADSAPSEPPAETAQPAPPSDEELRRVTITVSKAPDKKA